MQKPSNINDAQWAAVTHSGSHLLIIAGPGTGKTHTLVHRIAYQHQLYPDKKILAITFTQKAALEMRERLRAMKIPQDKIFAGTFHSFCLNVLKSFIDQTGLPKDFQVADSKKIEELAHQIWPAAKRGEIKENLEDISRFKSSGDEKFERNVKTFNAFLRNRNYLDYDDLLLETLQLLKSNREILKSLKAYYSLIFVDEFQDVNAVQHGLLKQLAGPETQITAIGDPNQAIYGFRGSDVGFFEHFQYDFKPAEVLQLNKNYRSTPNLLKACSQVIELSSFSVPPLTAQIYKEGLLAIHSCPTEKAEAEYVVHQIEKLVGGTSMFSQDSKRVDNREEFNYSFRDVAVLYRLNAQRKALEEAFVRSGIPFTVSGEKPPQEETIEHNIEKVHLLTLHASKGLEFPVVFIVGCEKGLIPLHLENFQTNIEEERRLFYVGMTRAKERLYLLSSKKRLLFGQYLENPVSPFINDIEESLKAYEQQQRKFKKRPEGKQLELFK